MILVEAWKLVVLQRYAKFAGRAGRAEFWWFVLANGIVYVSSVVLLLIGVALNSAAIIVLFALVMGVYWLGMIVPTLAVAARRLHDTNKSAWLLLLYLLSWLPLVGLVIAIVFIVFYATEGNPGPNNYGVPDPGLDAAITR
jgi:uncharacterized membrane protein YhaH (DUF805 family)